MSTSKIKSLTKWKVTYSMDVTDSTVWKVIVDDEVNSLEVYTTSHQLCTNQDPYLSCSETLDHIVTLKAKTNW